MTPAETRAAKLTPLPFVAIRGQCFNSHIEWVNKASSWLTSHPEYRDTQHPKKAGWQGHHFTALAFDQKGRRCRNGGDMKRADDENAFPVWWVWPDQIAELTMRRAVASPWRDVATDPPPRDRLILTCDPGDYRPYMVQHASNVAEWKSPIGTHVDLCSLWMPLPAPPEVQG
jgi:hypothetical protein